MQPELTDQTAIDRIRKCAAKLESNGGPVAKQWAGALYEAAEYVEKRMKAVTVQAEWATVRIDVADGGTVNFYEGGNDGQGQIQRGKRHRTLQRSAQ